MKKANLKVGDLVRLNVPTLGGFTGLAFVVSTWGDPGDLGVVIVAPGDDPKDWRKQKQVCAHELTRLRHQPPRGPSSDR